MSFIGGLFLARPLDHFDKHFSALRRIRNFSREGDAGSMHSILGFQARLKLRRSTEVISAPRASMPANRLASRMSASL